MTKTPDFSAISRQSPGTSGDASALRALNTFALDIIGIPNSDDLFWYVARNVVGRLKFVDCVIYQANAAQTELTQVAALGEKNPYGRTILNPLKISFGDGITGQVAHTRKPIVIDDLLKDQNYIADAQPARSEICVPLVSRGRVVGVIDSEHPDIGAFGSSDLEVLTTIAAMTCAKLELLAEVERSDDRYRELVQSHSNLTHEITNRKALEAELANARKLEAIGRLTGGFAHSFNNLLTVISGNLELVDVDALDASTRDCIGDARGAADQGAKLIRDMLAFSQRMNLNPKPVDLNALVRGSLLRNGHTRSNEIGLDLAEDLLSVNVDPVATEVALVNLLLNARDAMPKGGAIRIETRNVLHDGSDGPATSAEVPVGRYARLRVTDEGVGIAPAVLQRIYDPFFTTKPVGRGSTGLGLSMVLGFMRQSGGAVVARPAEPQGTSFDLYFPVAG